MRVRAPIRVVEGQQKVEGGGFVVRRPFPSRALQHIDPFLMLDEFGPVDYAPGEALGAPDHPHRGFETVTYLLAGENEHRDSTGHSGTLRAGGVQWMTAGDGIVHREMPSEKMLREGGRMHGFQLWVNLPRALKRTAPRYQELEPEAVPEVRTPDGRAHARLIAGEALGVSARVRTHTPMLYHHWRLEPGARVTLSPPASYQMATYVFEGTAEIGGRAVPSGHLAVLGDGDTVSLATEAGCQLLLLGGEPLRETIAWGGPFVMNNRAEIIEAFEDYRAGRMGTIPPTVG